MTTRRQIIGVLALAFTWTAVGESRGQFTGLQKMLFRATDFAGNPNYIYNPQGGPLFDNNIYDQRIEWNRLGQGWAFDQFRFFGPDSFDNPNTIDLGVLKLQLGRDPTVIGNPNPVGIHNRVGFTTTLIPEATFSSKTGQRNFDIFSGQTNFAAAPIHYDLSMDAGVQQYDWNGDMLIDSNGKINALGFYDLTIHLTNVGNATADGYALKDEHVTDFDTGPIHVSGNVLFDGIASLFQGDGLPVAASPFRILSGGSAKEKDTDELLARLKAGEKLSDAEMSDLLQGLIVEAFQKDPLGFLADGFSLDIPGFEAVTNSTTSSASTPSGVLDPSYVAASAAAGAESTATAQAQSSDFSAPTPSGSVPEPGTLVFLAGVIGTIGGMRSIQRRLR